MTSDTYIGNIEKVCVGCVHGDGVPVMWPRNSGHYYLFDDRQCVINEWLFCPFCGIGLKSFKVNTEIEVED